MLSSKCDQNNVFVNYATTLYCAYVYIWFQTFCVCLSIRLYNLACKTKTQLQHKNAICVSNKHGNKSKCHYSEKNNEVILMYVKPLYVWYLSLCTPYLNTKASTNNCSVELLISCYIKRFTGANTCYYMYICYTNLRVYLLCTFM